MVATDTRSLIFAALAEHFEISAPAISQHLKVLELHLKSMTKKEEQ